MVRNKETGHTRKRKDWSEDAIPLYIYHIVVDFGVQERESPALVVSRVSWRCVEWCVDIVNGKWTATKQQRQKENKERKEGRNKAKSNPIFFLPDCCDDFSRELYCVPSLFHILLSLRPTQQRRCAKIECKTSWANRRQEGPPLPPDEGSIIEAKGQKCLQFYCTCQSVRMSSIFSFLVVATSRKCSAITATCFDLTAKERKGMKNASETEQSFAGPIRHCRLSDTVPRVTR